MVTLYADECVEPDLVQALRALGYRVVASRGVGHAGRSVQDPEVLHYAAEHGLVVLTHNRWDFGKLHRTGFAHAGMVACRGSRDASDMAARLYAALNDFDAMTNQMIVVTVSGQPIYRLVVSPSAETDR